MSPEARYRALKGMKDILSPDIHVWQSVEEVARRTFASYGFQEMRTPVAEPTDLFVRGIGENTDIVEKEMYTFSDKGGRSVSLRPEGTASVVRSYVENRLYNLPQPQKFYYSGPMFRYERPQSGRYRQFFQIGAEVFGSSHAETDAELLVMLGRLLTALGLPELSFQINSIGCASCRPAYKEQLKAFLAGRLTSLCSDCNRRYEQNPLRIIDCKVPGCRDARAGAPRITEHLCGECQTHFDRLRLLLDRSGLSYTVNPDMVRGLDYYTRTTFEVTSTSLGAQNAVAAGGRYDRLVAEFGGPETPGVGFAMGMERIVELLKQKEAPSAPAPAVFIAVVGAEAAAEGFLLAERLRDRGEWIEVGDHTASLKSQLRRADRLAARVVYMLGEDELRTGKLRWKRLSDASQGELQLDQAAAAVVDPR